MFVHKSADYVNQAQAVMYFFVVFHSPYTRAEVQLVVPFSRAIPRIELLPNAKPSMCPIRFSPPPQVIGISRPPHPSRLGGHKTNPKDKSCLEQRSNSGESITVLTTWPDLAACVKLSRLHRRRNQAWALLTIRPSARRTKRHTESRK